MFPLDSMVSVWYGYIQGGLACSVEPVCLDGSWQQRKGLVASFEFWSEEVEFKSFLLA